MRNRILGLTLLLLMGFSNIFANTVVEVNQRVIKSFQKEFSHAQNVKWEDTKEFAKATFTLNGQVMFAYFAENGDLLGVTRNIVSGQLPINLLTDLKRNYADFWITDLFEIAAGNETTYYVTMENADVVLVVNSAGTSGWEVYQKNKKTIE